MALLSRVAKAWNAFVVGEQVQNRIVSYPSVPMSSTIPHVPRRRYTSERTIISSIYNRISIDVAGVEIRHVKLDDQFRYSGDVDSSLNRCLTLQPNVDQAPRSFRQDIVSSLFDHGAIAIVPVDATVDPLSGDIIDYLTLRVGEIKQWYPKHVRVNVYNEVKGYREEVTIEKRYVAIVENPLYSVINEPNSTLQRLITKLNLLDEVDEATASKKLDLIIQLPYVIKSEARRAQAEARRADIEFQLKESQYGIAYTDGTEKITQLNRPAENNLLGQVEYLTKLLYTQLGLTESVMNGTADEAAMLNYRNRTIEPILDAIVEAMQRSFLGIKGTTNKERIKYFQNPFKLVPLANIADIADKLSRNEVVTSNEIRGHMLGLAPSSDPRADKLMNSNMPAPPENRLSVSDMDSVSIKDKV